jgi:methionine synthase II (cobalamin-independent)
VADTPLMSAIFRAYNDWLAEFWRTDAARLKGIAMINLDDVPDAIKEEEVKLPEGTTLIPAVVGHCTDFIEHPDLVAERLVRYANLVGRENGLAGTDCGLGTRVGHPSICWAKFEAMAEGARRATKTLWGRA